MKNSTKTISSKLLLFTAAVALCFFVAEKSLAADEPIVGKNADAGKVIADVNIRNAKINETAKGTFDIAFDVENSMDVQSNLVYGIELIKKTTDGKTIFSDSKAYPDDKITIEKGEVVKKTITYSAPEFLAGNFELWINIKDGSGLMLALSVLQVNLSGTGQYVEFGNPCYLTIEGENGKKYSLSQGVDLKKEEKLFFNCQASNALGEAATLTPNFEFYLRDYFGEKTSAQADENQKISFTIKENKLIKIQIPLPEKPQSYDVKISLNQNQKAVSNPIFVHFVVSGASATIVNASLDKDAYKSGDTAIISAILAPSADGFSGSRNGNTVLTNTIVDVTFKDADGNYCAEKYQYDWTKTSYPASDVKMEVPITKDCLGPNVSLKMLENGVLLYEKDINLKAEPKVAEKKGENVATKTENKSGKAILVVIVLVCLVALGFLIWKLRHGRKIISILIFFISLMLLSSLPTGKAQAAVITLPGTPWWMTTADAIAVGSDNVVPLWPCDVAYGTHYSSPPPVGLHECPVFPPAPGMRPCKTGDNMVRFSTDPRPGGGFYNYICYQDVVSFAYDILNPNPHKGEWDTAVGVAKGINVCNNGVTAGVQVQAVSGVTPWTTVLGDTYFSDDQVPHAGLFDFDTSRPGFTIGAHTATFNFRYGHATNDNEYSAQRNIDYTVLAPLNCIDPLTGLRTSIPTSTITSYLSSTAGNTCANPCVAEQLTCNYDGNWYNSGGTSKTPISCTAKTCTSMWGACLENGSVTPAYTNNSPTCSCTGISGTVTCTNGSLTGNTTYPFGSCTPAGSNYQYKCLFSSTGDTCDATDCGKTITTDQANCDEVDSNGCAADILHSQAECVAKGVSCADKTLACPACPPSINAGGWKEVTP